MTSATERLRALLDERGVEYTTDDRQVVRYTDWGCWFFAEPLGAEPNTLGAQCELVCMPVTPEQAVAATLGPGTCRIIEAELDDEGCKLLTIEPYPDATSKDEWYGIMGVCSGCGEYVPKMNYCPNCGREVVNDVANRH